MLLNVSTIPCKGQLTLLRLSRSPLYDENNNNIMLTSQLLKLQLEFMQEQMANNLDLITTLRKEDNFDYSYEYAQEYEMKDSLNLVLSSS